MSTMQANNRIIYNTIVLYAKIVICMAISLYTVPLVLQALGQSDYGLFALIGGIIAMLAFMNGAMTVSTQRYMSVTIGERNNAKLVQVYNLSIGLHVAIGIVVVLLCEALMPLLFRFVLNILPEQQYDARLLFHTMIATMFLQIVIVPFDATINAYEDLTFFSVAGVIEAVLKLILVLALPCFSHNRLVIYAAAITAITLLILIIKYAYCAVRYKNLRLSLAAYGNKSLLAEMASFTGWNTLSSFALMARNQGIAIIFNHFLGTVINAAYGIATQVNGVLGYFSETIKKGINPQLMESEGLKEHQRLVSLTFAMTKYSLLILCFITLPLYIEMPYIISLWIGDAPAYTVEFTRIILILSLLTLASTGLMSAVQSSGKVKWYTIVICAVLLSTIAFAYVGLHFGLSPVTILYIACAIEVVAFFVRLWFARKLNGIPAWDYVRKPVLPVLLLAAAVGLVVSGCVRLAEPSFLRLIITGLLSVALFLPLSYFIILTKDEQAYFRKIVGSITKRWKAASS